MGSKYLTFVGTLTRPAPYFRSARGSGLLVYSFDEDTLDVEKLAETADVENPTFLSVSADGSHVYANSEIFGWKEGLVTAFQFDRQAGALRYINMQPTLGSITAQNALSRDNRRLFVANYGMGGGGPDRSIVIYDRLDDGGLTAPRASVALAGTGPNLDRQERSHSHSVTELPGDIIVVADLGADSLVSFRIGEAGRLEQLSVTKTAPGAGPRHVALHPNGKFLYAINELNSTIASYAIEGDNGRLTPLDAKPAVADAVRATSHCSDIQISPDGRFLYGANRGDDSIVVFETDAASGMLSQVGLFPCGGATPRNLAMTPSGRHLFSANQDADRIAIFARNPHTGALEETGRSIEIGTPMCVRFAR
ncbi:MAG: lactonase family protein [Rhizobium sp.]|nr:MAG: lactonase family protein [Rhizobium sp.]